MKVSVIFKRKEGPIIHTTTRTGIPNSVVVIGDHDVPLPGIDELTPGSPVNLQVKLEDVPVRGNTGKRFHLLGIGR